MGLFGYTICIYISIYIYIYTYVFLKIEHDKCCIWFSHGPCSTLQEFLLRVPAYTARKSRRDESSKLPPRQAFLSVGICVVSRAMGKPNLYWLHLVQCCALRQPCCLEPLRRGCSFGRCWVVVRVLSRGCGVPYTS